MRNKQVGEPQTLLHIHEQVDDLRLDRDVERGNRLVGDQQARLERERAGNAYTLALAAREFVRIRSAMSGNKTTEAISAATLSRVAALSLSRPWTASGSPTMLRIVMRGFSDP
jgi:hypothetical protein